MFRGVVLVGFRRLFSTPSQGRVVPVDGRCARPPSAKRAFSLERPTCVRSRSTTRAPSDGSFCSLGRTARARREKRAGRHDKEESEREGEVRDGARARRGRGDHGGDARDRACHPPSLHARDRIANDYDDAVVVSLFSPRRSRSRPVRRSHRFPPPYLADAHEGRHGGWRRTSPGPSASGSHSRGRYSSGGVHGGLGASSRGPARRPRRVRVFLKIDALPALSSSSSLPEGAQELLPRGRPDKRAPRHSKVRLFEPQSTLPRVTPLPPLRSFLTLRLTSSAVRVSTARRYAAYPTYGFEEYVPDLPDPEQARSNRFNPIKYPFDR